MSAFNDGSNVAKEESSEISLKSNFDSEDHAELEEGRVRRRGGSAMSVDKQNNSGPVLRMTVKPVKRFRPDSSCDKTNPSPVRKKRVKCSRDSTVGNGKNNPDALQPHCDSVASGFDSSPEAKLSTERNPDKSDVKIVSDKEKKPQVPANPAQDDSDQPIPKKKKRVWEQWTQEDKDYFFEAVAMYGKDFESIRTAIAHKHRKKGEDCVAKTKDQVRHLYYRTWTMISKLIDQDSYPLNINRAFQELYAVINYGEIRKRLGGSLKKKGIEKLNELIKDGSTSTRIKGKSFRIKTPACRALKKMNPAYQGKEGILDLPLISDTRRMKIPLQITLELFPLTMAAWNQVHSIAHNPRLKIRLNAQYQLSSVFTHLEKKWKPLSTKLLRMANQSTSKSNTNSTKLEKTQISSSWDRMLVIQTPPDASLNTRNMVFQVTNSKTHCIISYALRKSSQSRDKVPQTNSDNMESVKEPLTEIRDVPEIDMANVHMENNPGAISESELVDSCLSSEEDYDYDSANEAAFKDGCFEHSVPKNSTEKKFAQDYVCESLNTSFTLKEKGSDTNVSADDHETSLPDQTTSTQYSSTSINNPAESEQNSVPSTHLINGELPIDITSARINRSSSDSSLKSVLVLPDNKTMESLLSKGDSSAIMKDNTDESSSKQSSIESVKLVKSENHCDESKLIPEGVISSIVTSPINNKSCETNESVVTINSCAKTTDIENITSGSTKPSKKLVLSAKLFGKADGKKQKSVKLKKAAKPSTKTVQSWTTKDCRKITIAEIYMMLGKPSVFKLYYKWMQATTSSAEFIPPSSVDDEKQKISVSTGLVALIQAATLTRLAREKNETRADNENTNKEFPVSPKASYAVMQKLQKTKNASVQCELIKPGNKVDEKYSSTSSSTTSTASSNPHGRGMSKIVPVGNVIADTLPIAFAMPMIPANKPRRIAADPTKPVKGTMVSPETMNWLLQQSSRGRRSRKPIVGNRSQAKTSQPSLRRMKTFSIVTCGPNKVGFLPSKTIFSSRPNIAERMITIPSSGSQAPVETSSTLANSRMMTAVSSTEPVTLNIDELLGLEANTETRTNSTGSSLDMNLLARAAKEAGVAPATPGKKDSLENNMVLSTRAFVSQTETSNTMKRSNVTELTTVYANNSVSTYSIQSPNKEISGLFSDNLNIKLPTTSSPRPYISSLTTSNSIAPSLTLPIVDVISSSSVDAALMECSWSNHSFVPGIFPSLSDSLVDKLVHGANDITLSSLTNTDNTNNCKKTGGKNIQPPRSSPLCVINENSNSPTSRSLCLSSVNFDIHMTPIKSSDLPIHPWTINTNSRDSMGLSGLLNTPQKLIPSDMEDSLDGLLRKSQIMEDDRKRSAGSNGNELEVESSQGKKSDTDFKLQHAIQDNTSSSNFLAETDPEVDLQLQCMLNENSVDYISKFQDLVRQTTEYEDLPVSSQDDNARDGHLPPISPTAGLCQSLKSDDGIKDNG